MANEKKIYALQGAHNKGKSTTLIYLWQTILEKHKGGSEADYNELFVDSENFDFVGTICDVDGHKIGINSRGDDWKWIERWLPKLAEEKCSIIFCACRSYGQTEDAVRDFAEKSGYTVEFVDKDIADSKTAEEAVNKAQAKKLLEKAGL